MVTADPTRGERNNEREKVETKRATGDWEQEAKENEEAFNTAKMQDITERLDGIMKLPVKG